MTQRIVAHASLLEWLAPTSPSSAERAQGSLFAATLLPRQLPLYKAGPEEDEVFTRLANRGMRHDETLH